VSLNTFIQTIANGGGMSFSNGYDIEFQFGSRTSDFITYLKQQTGIHSLFSTNATDPGATLKVFCDEAQLPNTQSATGQLQGRYLGENQINYPYAKFYTDLSLGWMCDVNMTPLKFLTSWMGWIYDGAGNDGPVNSGRGTALSSLKDVKPNKFEREVRLNYPESYLCDLRITKTEKGPAAANQRAPISYILQDCYPYSIDSTPLSYGTSMVTKVSANFYYAKHTVVYSDYQHKGSMLEEAQKLTGVLDLVKANADIA